MTTDEQFEAQVKIDAQIHTEIMLLKPATIWIATKDGGESCCISDESRGAVVEFLERNKHWAAIGYVLGSWDRYPLYSTDPVASKQLRDKMAEHGFWYRIQGPFSPGDKHFAGFTEHSFTGWNGRPDNQCGADTEEMAVALAALAAKGKPVKP